MDKILDNIVKVLMIAGLSLWCGVLFYNVIENSGFTGITRIYYMCGLVFITVGAPLIGMYIARVTGRR